MRLYLSVLALFAIVGASGHAQTLSIRLVNGSSGKPIRNAYVNVWVGNARKDAIPVQIDSNGVAKVSLTDRESDVGEQSFPGNPAPFLYESEVRLQVGFVLCQVKQQKYSWLQIEPYSTNEWTHTGIVTANNCGKALAKPEPGVLTLFVRPLTFWEKLSE